MLTKRKENRWFAPYSVCRVFQCLRLTAPLLSRTLTDLPALFFILLFSQSSFISFWQKTMLPNIYNVESDTLGVGVLHGSSRSPSFNKTSTYTNPTMLSDFYKNLNAMRWLVLGKVSFEKHIKFQSTRAMRCNS